MSRASLPCPMSRADVIERYFMEHRAKLIDIAAFLDRLDRTAVQGSGGGGAGGSGGGAEDFRIRAFRAALTVLTEPEPGRARRVLERFSDHTSAPIDSAAGLKGAFGAAPGDDG